MTLLAIIHIYYDDEWEYLCNKLLNLRLYRCTYIFNIVNHQHNREKLIRLIRNSFSNCIILDSKNVGRDIGGKLAALDLALKLKIESNYTLVIHDKQSLHSPNGVSWRNELFKVVERNELPLIFAKFENDSKVGIIGSKKYLMSEYNPSEKKFDSVSSLILEKLIVEFNLNITDYHFIAGNVFWIKSVLLQDFFGKHSPLKIRSSLEKGNALDFHWGTHIHSWERIFSWLANMKGYKIAGI